MNFPSLFLDCSQADLHIFEAWRLTLNQPLKDLSERPAALAVSIIVETGIFPPVLRMVMATPDLLRANSAGKTGILPPVLWKAITMPDLPRTNNASQ